MKKRISTYRYLVGLLLLACSLQVGAVPAKRGMWRTIQLKNGKEVKAQLVGDEWFHYYADSLGNAYVERKNSLYKKVSKRKLQKMAEKSRKRRNQQR